MWSLVDPDLPAASSKDNNDKVDKDTVVKNQKALALIMLHIDEPPDSQQGCYG